MQSPLPNDVLISILSKNSFPQVVQLYRSNQGYQQLLENKDVLRQLTDIYRQEILQDDTLGDKQAIAWNIYPQTFAEYTELIRKERYDTLQCDRYHDVWPCIISALRRDDRSVFAQLITRKWESLTYAEKGKCLTEIMKFDRANFLEFLLGRGVKAGRALVEMAVEHDAPKTLALLLQRVSIEKDDLLEWIKLALRSSAEDTLQVLLKRNNVVDEGLAEEIMSMLEQWPLNNPKSMAMAKALLEFLRPVIVQGSSIALNKFLEIDYY